MRRLVHYFSTVILLSIGLIAVAAAWALHQGYALDAESKAYVDAAIPAIAGQWDEKQLLDRAAPELRSTVNPAQVKAQFGRFSRVGHLVEYQGAIGQATLRYNLGLSATISAAYVAKGRFQNGEAIFRIQLRKSDGRWLIQGFQVDAEPSGPAADHA